MAGKGSRPRPVDQRRFSENWDKIFNQPKKPVDQLSN